MPRCRGAAAGQPRLGGICAPHRKTNAGARGSLSTRGSARRCGSTVPARRRSSAYQSHLLYEGYVILSPLTGLDRSWDSFPRGFPPATKTPARSASKGSCRIPHRPRPGTCGRKPRCIPSKKPRRVKLLVRALTAWATIYRPCWGLKSRAPDFQHEPEFQMTNRATGRALLEFESPHPAHRHRSWPSLTETPSTSAPARLSAKAERTGPVAAEYPSSQ